MSVLQSDTKGWIFIFINELWTNHFCFIMTFWNGKNNKNTQLIVTFKLKAIYIWKHYPFHRICESKKNAESLEIY